jgi:hypothetical protein
MLDRINAHGFRFGKSFRCACAHTMNSDKGMPGATKAAPVRQQSRFFG